MSNTFLPNRQSDSQCLYLCRDTMNDKVFGFWYTVQSFTWNCLKGLKSVFYSFNSCFSFGSPVVSVLRDVLKDNLIFVAHRKNLRNWFSNSEFWLSLCHKLEKICERMGLCLFDSNIIFWLWLWHSIASSGHRCAILNSVPELKNLNTN